MGYKTDMHIHTTFSDGLLTPTEVVKRYKALEYDTIAITDHDTTSGLQEAMIAGEALEMDVVPGIEICTDIALKGLPYPGEDAATSTAAMTMVAAEVPADAAELHILGYKIDPQNTELQETLKVAAQYREERNQKLLEALQRMGIDVSEEDLRSENVAYTGKPTIARAIVKKGYASGIKEVLGSEKFFKAAEIATIKKKKISSEEAVRIINAAGGIAVLAHPMKIKNIGKRGSDEFYANLNDIVGRLKKAGLKGLECIYAEHSEEEKMRCVSIAEKYHLHITEGSDFHGDDGIHSIGV